MSEVADPHVGKTLENRYSITRRIADGGMASVYLATDTRLERTVAIKIIHAQLAQGPHKDQFIRRFHSEAKAAAALSNSHIVQIYDTGEFDGLYYIVMEYVRGLTLRQAMESNPTFSVRDTLRILSETLDGLSAAHQAGLVHRDIKPENILINPRGHVQITDFGLAKAVSDATMGTTGLLLGTAAYLAPEMIEENAATAKTDLYSVGIMGYEMLTGSVPFTSDNAITMVFKHVHDDVPPLTDTSPKFPAPLADIIASLAARDPKDRPADASEALAQLREASAQINRDDLFYRFDPTSTTTSPPAPPHKDLLHAPGAPVVEKTSVVPTPPASKTEVISKSKKKGAHKKHLLIWILSALVAVLAAAAAWWWFWGPASYWVVPEASDVTCTEQECSLATADFAQYEKTLKALQIDYSTTREFSDTIESGDIISANPDVGGRVSKRGGVLALTVSKGMQRVTIPADLLDCTAEKTPEKTLLDLGLSKLTVREEFSLDAAKGCAVSVSQAPGTTLNHNTAVTLTVSKGPKPVEVPQLSGVSQDDATKELEALKLSVTVEEEFSDSIAEGSVIGTDPSGGQSLFWGDDITVKVSKGPETVVLPSVVGMQKDAAVKRLEDLGFTVKTQSSQIGEMLHVVFSQSGSAGKPQRLRDTEGKPTVITLTIV